MIRRMFGMPEVPEIDAGDAHAIWTEQGAQFVDVREDDEWHQAHMPKSVHMPLATLPARFGELDPTQPVIVVCLSGSRSLNGTQFLLQSGFSDVRSMRGGLAAWSRAGLPLER